MKKYKQFMMSLAVCAIAALGFAAIDPDWIVRAVDDDEQMNNQTFDYTNGTTKVVRQLSIRSDGVHYGFTKSGADELQLGSVTRLTGDGNAFAEGAGMLDVRVNEGSLTVLPATSASDELIVTPSYLHLDASAEGAFELENENEVATWKDLNAGGHSAVAGYLVSKPTSKPRLVTSDKLNKPVVDFGVYAEGDNICEATGTSYMMFDEASVREGFFVMRQKPAGASGSQPFFLGCSSGERYPFHRSDNANTIAGNDKSLVRILAGYADESARGGVWHVDGARVSPEQFFLDTEFHLVSFAADKGLPVDDFCWDRGNRCGGLEIAEVILFTEELEPLERRAIEMKLMAKWLPEKAYPAAQTPFTFASLVSTNLTAQREVVIDSLGTGSRTFVKDGPAPVAVKAIDKVTGAVAEEGSLSFDFGLGSLLKTAFFHLDPNVEESLVYDSTGRVSKVMSVVGDGNYAFNSYTARSGAELKKITVGEKTLNVLDFGPYYACSDGRFTNNAPESARAPEGVCGMNWYQGTDSMRSFFVVVKDNETIHPETFGYGTTAISDQYLLGHMVSPALDRSSHYLIATNNTAFIGDIGWKLDTLPVAPRRTELPGGYHIISCVIPDGYPSLSVNRIAQDTRYRIGGLTYGEVIVFTRTLTNSEESDILDYLVDKWRAGETYDVDAVEQTAWIHYNPSDAASLTMVNENEVVEMRDIRAAYTYSHKAVVTPEVTDPAKTGCRANPTLVAYGDDGLKLLDFGTYDEVALATSTDASGMMFNSGDNEGYQTIFVVAKRKSSGTVSNEQFLFGGSRNANVYQFHSNSSTYLDAGNSASTVRAAEWYVDNVKITPESTVWPVDQVEVIAIRSDESLWFSQLAQDRGARIGGLAYGEILIYREKLSDRNFRMVYNKLLKKWKGIDGDEIPAPEAREVAYTSWNELGLGGGAQLMFGGNLALTDNAAIAFELPAGRATVGGAFKAGANVAVTVTAKAEEKIVPGTYPVLSADSYVDSANFAGWTLDAASLEPRGYKAELKLDANGLPQIVVTAKGLVIMVR